MSQPQRTEALIDVCQITKKVTMTTMNNVVQTAVAQIRKAGVVESPGGFCKPACATNSFEDDPPQLQIGDLEGLTSSTPRR
jgi:hypothetical protein